MASKLLKAIGAIAGVVAVVATGGMIAPALAAGSYATAAAWAAGSLLISAVTTRLLAPKNNTGQDTGSRIQNPPATQNSLPVVYGSAYLGGTIIDVAPTTDNQTIYYVVAIASRSESATAATKFDQREFYFGDKLMHFQYDATKATSFNETCDYLTDGSGISKTDVYNNLFVYLYESDNNGNITGFNTNQLPSAVMGASSGLPTSLQWLSTRQMKNTIFAIVKVKFNQSAGTTGLAPLTFRMYHSPSSSTAVLPGDVLYDYMTNKKYGCALDPSLVDSTAVTALNLYGTDVTKQLTYVPSAGVFPLGSTKTAKSGASTNIVQTTNVVNNTITFNTVPTGWAVGDLIGRTGLDAWATYTGEISAISGNLVTIKSVTPVWRLATAGDGITAYANSQKVFRYMPNGVLDTGQTCLDNLNHIVSSCDSWLTYNNALGKWSVVINDTFTPVFTFDDTNIIGPIDVSTVNLNSTPNIVEVRFPNALNKDQIDYYTADLKVTNPLLLNANEPTNKLSTTFALVSDSVRAQYLGNRFLAQGREDLTVTLRAAHNSIQVDVGDVVNILSSNEGWNTGIYAAGKPFRVMRSTEVVGADGVLSCDFELSEYNNSVYSITTISEFQPAKNSALNDPTYFGTLTAPTATVVSQTASIPSINVSVPVPLTGSVTEIDLFVSFDNGLTWTQKDIQTKADGSVFTPNVPVTFVQTGIPITSQLRFAYVLANEFARSGLSAASNVINWNPTITTPAGALSLDFTPDLYAVSIPSGSTSTSGLSLPISLQVLNASAVVNLSTATSDSAMAENTWRIGSGPTAFDDWTATSLTVGAVTKGASTATWTMSAVALLNGANLLVPIRYKAIGGVVTGLSQQFNVSLIPAGAAGATPKTIDITGYTGFQSSASGTVFSPSSATLQVTAQNFTPTGYAWTITGGTAPTLNAASVMITPSVNATSITAAVTVSEGATQYNKSVIMPVVSNGAAGANGYQSAFPSIWQWTSSTSAPAKPTVTSTYDWNTGAFLTTPTLDNGWSYSQPTSTTPSQYLWEMTAPITVASTGAGQQTTVQWNRSTNVITPVVVSYNGSNGTAGNSTYTADVYLQQAGTPTAPSGGSYNFSTNTLTAPSGWNVAQPASTTTPTYAATFTFSGTGTVSGGTWSNVRVVAQNGTNGTGTNGTSVYTVSVYTQSGTAPTVAPTGGTYVFSTNTLTVPTSSGYTWSRTQPASSTTPTYASTATFSGTVDSVSNPTWTTPVLVAQVGAKGDTGSTGSAGAGSYFIQIAGAVAAPPSDAQFNMVAGRYPIVNDLATVQPTSGLGATTVYRCTVSYPSSSWTPVTQYIPGSLIVQNTINATQVSGLNFTASKQVQVGAGTFNLQNSPPTITGGSAVLLNADTTSGGSIYAGSSTLGSVFSYTGTGGLQVNSTGTSNGLVLSTTGTATTASINAGTGIALDMNTGGKGLDIGSTSSNATILEMSNDRTDSSSRGADLSLAGSGTGIIVRGTGTGFAIDTTGHGAQAAGSAGNGGVARFKQIELGTTATINNGTYSSLLFNLTTATVGETYGGPDSPIRLNYNLGGVTGNFTTQGSYWARNLGGIVFGNFNGLISELNAFLSSLGTPNTSSFTCLLVQNTGGVVQLRIRTDSPRNTAMSGYLVFTNPTNTPTNANGTYTQGTAPTAVPTIRIAPPTNNAEAYLDATGNWSIPSGGGGGGGGTVTSVTSGVAGFTFNNSGSTPQMVVNGGSSGQFLRQDGNWASPSSSGLTSVTVNAGTGMSGGGTISTSGGAVTLNNAGVTSISGSTGAISFTGTGVSQSGNTFTFSGGSGGSGVSSINPSTATGSVFSFSPTTGASVFSITGGANGQSIRKNAISGNLEWYTPSAAGAASNITNLGVTINTGPINGLSRAISYSTSTSVDFTNDWRNGTVDGSPNRFYIIRGTANDVGAYLTGTGNSWTFNSDARLKNIQRPIEDGALNRVRGFVPKYFTWKAHPEAGEVLGVIAQEVQEHIPDAVEKNGLDTTINGKTDQYFAVSPQVVNFHLLKAVQELADLVDSLKARIDELEAK